MNTMNVSTTRQRRGRQRARPAVFDPMRHMLSPLEVASLYGVTLRQVYYALDLGLIRSQRWGRNWMIDIRDLPDSWPTSS